ncbi:MAG: helix-turn-helix domain-containing protein [Terriglobales bacterium]
MERKLALLLVNADMRLGMVCNQAAKKIDCELRIANDWESIFSDVSSGTVTAVLVDADSTPSCTELIKRIKENSARVEVLVAGTNPPISTAVEAIRSGASDYLEKPLQADVVEQALVEAFKRHGSFQARVVPFKEVEKQAIRNAMAQAEGDKVKAARLLSMGKTTLYRKLREYGDHTRRRRHRDPEK